MYRVVNGCTLSLCNHTLRLTQPPTLSWTECEYRPKCGDALRLKKVKAGMTHFTYGLTCGWQVKLCDPSLTSHT